MNCVYVSRGIIRRVSSTLSTNMNNQDLLKVIIKCVNFACQKHKNQRRKNADAEPYVNHPVGVAYILTEEAGIYDVAVIEAALLHDTVEDTDTTFEEIEEHFGKEVASIVREVTDDKSLPKLERKRLQIVHAGGSSPQARFVKMADKLYNLRDLQRRYPVGWSEARAQEYFKWGKEVIDQIRGTNKSMEDSLDRIFQARGLM